LQGQRAFTTLDGLRGIAALAVLTRHAPEFFGAFSIYVASPETGELTPVGPFFESYLAVDFFFALSGFVLSHAYGKRLQNEMSALSFMAVRLVRLYPLYLLALAISVSFLVRDWQYVPHHEKLADDLSSVPSLRCAISAQHPGVVSVL
jgi:peptidoglycan/LPS O-acetylase OafA/YrhL